MKTILLIDDDQEVLEVLAEILRMHRYTLITRQDSHSALDLIKQKTCIDLVITDYWMPGMDGLQLVRQLRQVLPKVPVILLTGYESLESYCQANALWVSKYIMKPVRAKELVQEVSHVLANEEACSTTERDSVPLMAPGEANGFLGEYKENMSIQSAVQD